MGACASKVVEVDAAAKLPETAGANDRQIQEKMHSVRLARLEVENSVAGAAVAEIKLEETTTETPATSLSATLSVEEISKMVSPAATLPTVEKVYAPNVYPDRKVSKEVAAEAAIQQESKSSAGPAPTAGILQTFKSFFGKKEKTTTTAGAA